jgi:CRP-like cAMP-binding protein
MVPTRRTGDPGFAFSGAVDHNTLLSALPNDELRLLADSLEQVSLAVEESVFEPNTPIDHVFFPTHGVLSLLATDDAGGMIEVGTIGNEGMAGLFVFHNADTSPHRCFCQVAAVAQRLPVESFKRLLPGLPRLRERLHRYSQCFFTDVAQSVVCNSLHSVEQRCARWLLMTHDRVGARMFELKQSFLSFMIAARRNAVSEAAGALAKRGLIRYSRARIEVLDRKGLEKAACSCYRITRDAYDKLLGELTS